jgi:hypothetical protein
MNTFLLFMILIFFVYEFSKRMNYLKEIDENDAMKKKEYFDNINLNMTYLPNNFYQEFERNIKTKNISKDLGVKRSINQVVAANDETIGAEILNFFTPLDVKLFRNDMNRWVNKQRDWQEAYTILDPIIDQIKNINTFSEKT